MQLTRHEFSTIRTALHTERRAGEIAESRMAELEDWLASLQMPSVLTPPKPPGEPTPLPHVHSMGLQSR